MNVCIIFAMKEEAQSLLNDCEAKQISSWPFKVFQKDNILIAISGIGLVNASSCLTFLETNYKINFYINCGLVGSVNDEYKSLECLVIKKTYFSTANATGFGYNYGQIPQMPKFFSSDLNLIDQFLKTNKDIKICNIASSDIFINSLEKKESFIVPIKDQIDVVDMEYAALCQAAYLFKKPIFSFKIVSDKFTNKTNEQQFKEILDIASQEISSRMIVYLKDINLI